MSAIDVPERHEIRALELQNAILGLLSRLP